MIENRSIIKDIIESALFTAKIEDSSKTIVKRMIGTSKEVLLILILPSKIIFKEKKTSERRAIAPRTACLGKAYWSVVRVEIAIGITKNRIPSRKRDKFSK